MNGTLQLPWHLLLESLSWLQWEEANLFSLVCKYWHKHISSRYWLKLWHSDELPDLLLVDTTRCHVDYCFILNSKFDDSNSLKELQDALEDSKEKARGILSILQADAGFDAEMKWFDKTITFPLSLAPGASRLSFVYRYDEQCLCVLTHGSTEATILIRFSLADDIVYDFILLNLQNVDINQILRIDQMADYILLEYQDRADVYSVACDCPIEGSEYVNGTEKRKHGVNCKLRRNPIKLIASQPLENCAEFKNRRVRLFGNTQFNYIGCYYFDSKQMIIREITMKGWGKFYSEKMKVVDPSFITGVV